MSSVYVGLSGGVDSAVSAYLLQKAGYDVTGVFIKIWSPEFLECTWRDDRLDALRVCVALGIPFREIDLSAQYRTEVVENMVRSYTHGITPNPDILCNEKIKFGHFARWAFDQGAEYVATGHYARLEHGGDDVRLLRAIDPTKDQSYFLSRVDPGVLRRALFPIGDLEKSAVRDIARGAKLPVASKPDSQGLCFVGEVSLAEFLSRFMTVVPGDIEDMQGTVIGAHEGAALYTKGQRHGLVVHGEAGRVPHYVVDVDTARNVVRVSPEKADAMVTEVALKDVMWFVEIGSAPVHCMAQARYHGDIFDVTIGGSRAVFDEPHMATPGQSLVLYRNDECIGSGIICL